MVSKIAVMALVAVVAVPILLGYGLNVTTETYTDWKESNDKNNYTNYLGSIVDATKRDYTDADLYQFNSRIFYSNAVMTYPYFNSVTQTKTPIRLGQGHFYPVPGDNVQFFYLGDHYSSGIVDGQYDANNYYSITLTTNGNTYTFNHLKSWYWTSDGTRGYIEFALTEAGPDGGSMDGGYDYSNITAISTSYTGYPLNYYRQYNWQGTQDAYADISKGYRLNVGSAPLTSEITDYYTYRNKGFGYTGVYPEGICKDIMFTFDLNSIGASTYYFGFRFPTHDEMTLYLQKRVVDGQVEWWYRTLEDGPYYKQLYFNPDLSSNTYQIYFDGNTGGELRYIGAWQDTIAPMPALITYPFEYRYGGAAGHDYITRIDLCGYTPTMRIDYAQVAAYEYKIIQDTTFEPGVFKTNPVTKLTNFALFGDSLEFGGNVYAVNDGKIIVNSRQINLTGIRLSSVFTGNSYENMINGTVVSTSATPSSIVFNGDWVMQVETASQTAELKETTHWVAGKFAWQGMDTNFKIAGLLASVGAFIALAVYARGSGARIWPLLLVCGGAALMFLVMI